MLGVEVLPIKRALDQMGRALKSETEATPYHGGSPGQGAQGSFVSFVDPQAPTARAALRPGERLAPLTRLPKVIDVPAVLMARRGAGTAWVVVRPERGQRQVCRVVVR